MLLLARIKIFMLTIRYWLAEYGYTPLCNIKIKYVRVHIGQEPIITWIHPCPHTHANCHISGHNVHIKAVITYHITPIPQTNHADLRYAIYSGHTLLVHSIAVSYKQDNLKHSARSCKLLQKYITNSLVCTKTHLQFILIVYKAHFM